MANTNLDIILSSMGRSQDPGYDDILSGMGGSQPGGPIVISLNALLLSSTSFLTGGATSVGILNKTAGSAIAATSSDGTTLSVSGSTLTGTFTAAGTPNITLVETLAGATNSPRTSSGVVTVAASGPDFTPYLATYAAPTDADAIAYTNRMTVAPSAEQASIYDYFVKRAKAIGSWTYLTDCGFLAAHTQQAALLGVKNVINPTLVGTGHTHSPGYGIANNFTGAISTGYKIPTSQQDNLTAAFYVFKSSESGSGDMGNTSHNLAARYNSPSDTLTATLGSAAVTAPSYDGIGVYRLNRTGASATAGAVYLRDTVPISSVGTSVAPDQTYDFWFLGKNGSTVQYGSGLGLYWDIGTGMPDAIAKAHNLLVEQVCAMLSASTTALPTLTRKTKSLYRYMIEMTRQSSYLFGCFDNTYWPVVAKPNTLDQFSQMTGGDAPAITTIEWADPNRADANAATDAAAQLQRIKTAYAAGTIISVNYHAGNPVTGSLEAMPTLTVVAGADKDTSGTPVPTILDGGSNRAKFLALVDREIAFFKSCVDANGEPIPMIFRPFHEINGNFFWWSDNTTPANSAQMVRDLVDRFRAAGVVNVLFDFNTNNATFSAWTNYFSGATYCDFVSDDFYQTTGTATGMSAAKTNFEALTGNGRKPTHFAEIGFPTANDNATFWRDSVGYYVRDRMRRNSHIAPWHSLHMPLATDASAAGYTAAAADPFAITRSKLPAFVFNKIEGMVGYNGTITTVPSPTPIATPAPAFTTQPTISPASGTVGQVFTATQGTASNASSYAGQWLLNGTAISGATGLTYTSTAAGSLTYRSTATGAGGSTPATTTAVTVSAASGTGPVVLKSDDFNGYPDGTKVSTRGTLAANSADTALINAAGSVDGPTVANTTELVAFTSAAFGNGVYGKLSQYVHTNSGNNNLGLAFRHTNDVTTFSGIVVRYSGTNIAVVRYINGTATTLGTAYSYVAPTGATFSFSANLLANGTINVYLNNGTTPVITTTNTLTESDGLGTSMGLRWVAGAVAWTTTTGQQADSVEFGTL